MTLTRKYNQCIKIFLILTEPYNIETYMIYDKHKKKTEVYKVLKKPK